MDKMLQSVKKIIVGMSKTSYAYGIISKGVHIVFGFLLTVFVNRALGSELKGEYAYITNLISIISIVGGIGIYQLYPYYIRKNGSEAKEKFVNLLLHLVIVYFSILFLIIPIVAGEIDTLILVLLSGVLTIFQILSTQLLMISLISDYKITKKRDVFIYFIRFLFAILVYIFFEKNIYMVFLSDLIYRILTVIIYLKIINVKMHLHIDFKFMIEIVKKGIVPMVFTLLLSLNYNIDIIYMKLFSEISLSDIGLYSVGVQLAGYIWTIPDIFKEVLYSKTKKDNNSNEAIWCVRISLIIELFFLFLIFIFGDKLLYFLYGNEFVPAIGVTKIIFVGVLAMTLFKVLTPIYNARGEFKLNLVILLMSIIINVILNIVLIPPYGIVGAAIASVFGYSVCGILYLIRFCKDYSVSIHRIFLFKFSDVKKLVKSSLDKN